MRENQLEEELKRAEEIYEGLKEVWASPFEFRSFSWRQSLIDDPIWVLSSVVILEPVPNDKSGVLVKPYVKGYFTPPFVIPHLRYVSIQK